MKNSFGLRSPISRRKFIIIAVLSFVVLIGIWTLLTEAGLVNCLFLPSPVKVCKI